MIRLWVTKNVPNMEPWQMATRTETCPIPGGLFFDPDPYPACTRLTNTPRQYGKTLIPSEGPWPPKKMVRGPPRLDFPSWPGREGDGKQLPRDGDLQWVLDLRKKKLVLWYAVISPKRIIHTTCSLNGGGGKHTTKRMLLYSPKGSSTPHAA